MLDQGVQGMRLQAHRARARHVQQVGQQFFQARDFIHDDVRFARNALGIRRLAQNAARKAATKKYLQEQLQKTGDEYEKLRQESGLPALPANGVEGGRLITERGLDSLGTTPLTGTTPVAGRSSDDSDDE